jgi:hypothetical protein
MAKQSRRGRRPKDQKRIPLSMRTTPSTRAQLEAAAAKNGRSITQEAEIRLGQSFSTQDLLDQVLELTFGRIDGDLVNVLGKILRIATSQANVFTHAQCWCDDPSAFKATETFIKSLFDRLRPKDDADDGRAETIQYFMGRAIIQEFSGDKWISERSERLGYRANAVDDWRQQIKHDIETQPIRKLVTIDIRAPLGYDQPAKPSKEEK